MGCKSDLRNDSAVVAELRQAGKEITTPLKGDAMARALHALAYVECSAKSGENVKDVFERAGRAALTYPNRSVIKRRCPLF